MKKRYIRYIFYNLLAGIIMLVSIFIVVEIGARLYAAFSLQGKYSEMYRYSLDRDIFYEFTPNWEGEYFPGYFVKINSFGLNDDEIEIQKPKNTLRILCLGDSMTFGWRVNKENAYPNRLEKLLQNTSSNMTFQVINAAIPGYNARQEVAYLTKYGNQWKPDIVLLGFYINDLTTYNEFPGRVYPKLNPKQLPCTIEDLARKSFAYQLLRNKIELLWEKYIVLRKVQLRPLHNNLVFLNQKWPWGLDLESYWTSFEKQISAAKKWTDQRKILFILVVFPESAQLDDRSQGEQLQNRLKFLGEELGIYVIDLLPAFRDSKLLPLFSLNEDQHPNDLGHQIAAQVIFQFLQTKRLVPFENKNN